MALLLCVERLKDKERTRATFLRWPLAPRRQGSMSLLSKPKILMATLGAMGAGLVFVLNPRIVSGIASSYGWAHAYCYLNNSRLVWLRVISDSAIYVSYLASSVVTAVALPPLLPKGKEFIEAATSPNEPHSRLEEGTSELVRANEMRSEEHTSELQSHLNLVCRLLLEKKKHIINY